MKNALLKITAAVVTVITLSLVMGATLNPKLPLYTNPDGTVAAPTQFLSRVFIPGANIQILDSGSNLVIMSTGGSNATFITNISYQAITTNLTVVNNTYSSNFFTTNLYASSSYVLNQYISNTYTTNLTVYETNVVNYQITTNLYVLETNITSYTITTNLLVYQTNIANYTITTNLTVVNNAYVSNIITTNLTVINQVAFDGHNAQVGYVWTCTNAATGEGEWQVSASGGIMSASNSLYNAMLGNGTTVSNGCVQFTLTTSNALWNLIGGSAVTLPMVTNVVDWAASNRVAVVAGTNVIVRTNNAGNVMLYEISVTPVADNLFVTNITVVSNLFAPVTYTTNLYVNNTAYVNNLYATNITVISNASIKGNTYISQTNLINYLVATNLAEFKSNIYVAGTTFTRNLVLTNQAEFYGPALSYSGSASNAPAENEFPTAKWVRSLFNNGLTLFSSTNIFTAATNTGLGQPMYTFTNTIPPTSSRYYTAPSAGDYVGGVITTNRFTYLQGPVYIRAFLQRTNGTGSPTIAIHPELYYSYDGTNWAGDFSANDQTITTGTNVYEWVISFSAVTATNTTGFYLQRRFKVGSATGSTRPDLVVHVGTNYVSGVNDASHISIAWTSGNAVTTVHANTDNTFTGVNTFSTNTVVNGLYQTNRTITIATNATSATLDFSSPRDWVDVPTLMVTNLVLSPTNLMAGREVWVFFTAANGNYDVTITNTAATDIRWNLNSATNGTTSFTVTNGARAELSIVCRTNNVLHAVYGQYR